MARATLLLATLTLGAPAALAAVDVGSDAQREAGKKLYAKHCSQCHGDKGDGQGAAAPFVLPKPRDFTSGKYKIRSTPSGALPTTEDLKNIIRKGMPYTAMPAWPQLNDGQLTELAYYLKSFSRDFANPDRQPKPIDLPSAPAVDAASIERGKALYAELGCARCHGDQGRSDGVTAPTLKDDAGNTLRPADLTRRWTFRGGPARGDIFKAFSTGLNGTPMPSFADALSVEKRWDLANFVHSLSPSDTPGYDEVISVKKVVKEIDLADPTLFDQADPAFLPVIGQIMQPVRAFFPASNGVAVRAVYNETDIAFELRWNDMRADTSGKNGPEIAVPLDEDKGDQPAPAAGGEAEGGGWGDAEAADDTEKPADDPWGEEEGAAAAPAGSEFSDAVAIQIPVEMPGETRKPYFIFGEKSHPVNLWFADLAAKEPQLYVARGSDGLEKLGPRELESTSHFDKGEWRVVLARKLRSPGELTFEEGGFVPIAFSLWDGTSRERGSKRGLTSWWTAHLAPGEKQSPVGNMILWAGGILGAEALFIAWARRRRSQGTDEA